MSNKEKEGHASGVSTLDINFRMQTHASRNVFRCEVTESIQVKLACGLVG